ncbi:MAG TPA: alpha/beta hydrolase [Acidimicrobiia bacterium]|nr:alpha/beta hydrolase [Acidimicrobiia bacterium]
MEPSVEAIEFNRQLEQLLSEYPRVDTISPSEARSEREEGRSAFGPLRLSERAVERTIETKVGDLRLRCFLPDNPRGVYLHIHGGGWVLGGIHHQDPRLERLSDTCGLAVLSVDYRLAPECPYPAAPDDCEAAALWLAENAPAEFGTERLLIGGESAGAHLSVVTLLRMRDRHGLTPFVGANLVYGAYDLRLSQSCRSWGDRLLVLNTPITEYFVRSFVPAERLEDPDVSPILADLSGLPPALFTVGTEDPLYDDTQLMFERWRAAGNGAELAVYPGGAHGFDAFPIALAEEALTRMYDFLERC